MIIIIVSLAWIAILLTILSVSLAELDKTMSLDTLKIVAEQRDMYKRLLDIYRDNDRN